METSRHDQDVDDGAERPPSGKSADGGNGDSGQQLEHTSGDEQSEEQPGQPLGEQAE